MRPGRYKDPRSTLLTQTAFVGDLLLNLINQIVYKLSHIGDIKILGDDKTIYIQVYWLQRHFRNDMLNDYIVNQGQKD